MGTQNLLKNLKETLQSALADDYGYESQLDVARDLIGEIEKSINREYTQDEVLNEKLVDVLATERHMGDRGGNQFCDGVIKELQNLRTAINTEISDANKHDQECTSVGNKDKESEILWNRVNNKSNHVGDPPFSSDLEKLNTDVQALKTMMSSQLPLYNVHSPIKHTSTERNELIDNALYNQYGVQLDNPFLQNTSQIHPLYADIDDSSENQLYSIPTTNLDNLIPVHYPSIYNSTQEDTSLPFVSSLNVIDSLPDPADKILQSLGLNTAEDDHQTQPSTLPLQEHENQLCDLALADQHQSLPYYCEQCWLSGNQ